MMGLSFYYKGKLKEAATLKALIEEVKDIAKTNNWSYYLLKDAYKNHKFKKKITVDLYGITVSAPKCEPLFFSFMSNGMMYDVLNFTNLDFSGDIEVDPDFYISTKTQFAGPEIHKQLINLLDYVADKYLTYFDCIDDGNYWESSDEELLKESFTHFASLLNTEEQTFKPGTPDEIEAIKDHLNSLSEATLETDHDSEHGLPELSIEEEIEFKKMKLSLEQDVVFRNENPNIPPEIENQFLDYVIDFEEQFANAKQMTVFEKLGKPTFKVCETLTDDEVDFELEHLFDLMVQHNLALDVICEYENQNRLIYSFITKELFYEEINDIQIPGMITNFIYEEFHPNEAQDIKDACLDFVNMFLNKKSDFYKKYHFEDVTNHLEVNAFRKLFKKFKILYYNFENHTVTDDQAVATFSIEFSGKMKHSNEKINFKGVGEITLVHQYGFWYVKYLQLPV